VSNGQVSIDVNGGSQFVVGGKVYTSLDELPPEARLKYDQAIAKLGPLMSDTNMNGIPDMLEGAFGGKPGAPASVTSTTMEIPPADTLRPSAPMLPQEPPQSVIQEETTNFGAIALIMLVALILIGAMGVGVYIFFNLAK
jgi:hypothetical protein